MYNFKIIDGQQNILTFHRTIILVNVTKSGQQQIYII